MYITSDLLDNVTVSRFYFIKDGIAHYVCKSCNHNDLRYDDRECKNCKKTIIE